MLSPLLLLTTLALLAVTAAGFDFPNCESGPLSGTPICDETLPYMARARWIVSKMNVTEKVLRLQNSSPAIDRLGLPAYEWWSEALHGVAWSPGVNFPDGPFSCATSFPEPIGLGATFDRQLVYDVAMTTSTEGRAFSNNGVAGLDFWTPNINIFRSTRRNTRYDYHTSFVSPTAINLVGDADLLLLTPLHSSSTAVYRVSRDPRWGRGQETPGEDPYLSSEYVFYLIKGYQEGEDKKYYKVVADCKHYAGYDVENWHGNDRYGYNAIISNQDLVETYLPSFKSCLKDAKVGSAMCSYNAVNGVPACANGFLMNDIARGRWGWEGWITSDCGAVSGIYDGHHYAQNHSSQVQLALRGGCDIGCDSALTQYGEQAYDEGYITDYDLDLALSRQFASLVRLGYFDSPVNQPYRHYGAERVATTPARRLSLRAALESIVLLKNDGTLPLSRSSVKTIALIGPNANASDSQIGNYNGQACFMHTPLDSLSALQGVTVNYAYGADVNGTTQDGFQTALTAAKSADVIIYVGGINQTIEGEGNDRNTIDLPGQQVALIQQLAQVGKPFIVVLWGGGGVDVSEARDNKAVNAMIWHGYPSQSGGDALVEVLFGRYAPAGKLPVTWYPASYVDAVPMTDQSMRASAGNPGRTYKFYFGNPVFEFGHGLTYSTFSYTIIPEQTAAIYNIDELSINAKLDDKLTDISLTVNVTNTGKVVSEVVVLAFVASNASVEGVSPPYKELFDYARPLLGVGESTTLVFGLSYRVLAHVDQDGHQWLLPGKYKLALNNEEDAVHHIELQGEAVMIEDFPKQNSQRTTPEPVSVKMHRHERGAK